MKTKGLRQSSNIEDARDPKGAALANLKMTMQERAIFSDHATDDTPISRQQGDPDERATNKGLNLHYPDRMNREPGFLQHKITTLKKF